MLVFDLQFYLIDLNLTNMNTTSSTAVVRTEVVLFVNLIIEFPAGISALNKNDGFVFLKI